VTRELFVAFERAEGVVIIVKNGDLHQQKFNATASFMLGVVLIPSASAFKLIATLDDRVSNLRARKSSLRYRRSSFARSSSILNAGWFHGSSLNSVRTKSFTAIRVAFAAASL
jgi:hypothetical protein